MSTTRPVLEEDTLFIACTRPAMFAGVTMEAMGINVMATTIFYLAAGSVAYALVGVVFHFLFRALVKHDHNMFRDRPRVSTQAMTMRNTSHWGGTSISPLKLSRHFDEKDLGFA